MSNHNYHYRDDDFSLDKAGTYTLLLQVETASFSYAIVDEGKKLLAWHSNCEIQELQDPNQLDYILTSPYEKVVIGLPDKGFSLVPSVLYNANDLSKLSAILDVKENEKVLAHKLDKLNHIVFKADKHLIEAITTTFDVKNIVFNKTGWINAIANTAPLAQNLYLNIENDMVDISYFSKGRLRYYNHFEFNNHDELVYYTMLATNELQLDPRNLILVLSGDASTGDDNTSRLGQFFAGLIYNKIQLVSLPVQLQSYKILSQIALLVCGSSEER